MSNLARSLLTLLSAVCCSFAATAFAQSGDAVVVLYNGAVETVEVFDLGAANEVQRLGDRRIVPTELGPVQITDLKILPDGSHLLAHVDGRGAAITTPTGDALRWELDPNRRLAGTKCASAYTFFAPGEPSLVLSGDSETSNVTLRNTAEPNTVWFDTMRLSVARGDIPQTIALPNNRVATAVNWLTANVYGVIVSTTDEPLNDGRETLNVAHSEATPDARIVPELGQIRDLMGLGEDRLLVTMRYGILVLDANGELERHIDLGDLPGVHGELASVRVLPDGLWAIATFEPGLWIQPHANHRVHWYDPQTQTIVATSEPLRRAPLRVEPYLGMGGTGTAGYDGGLSLIQQGDPESVDLISLVMPQSIPQGREVTVVAQIKNSGAFPVALRRVVVRAGPGTCAEVSPRLDFASASSVALNPEQVFRWSSEVAIGSSFEVGPWCAFVQAVDLLGNVRDVGAGVPFEVTEPDESTGSTIVVRPLPPGVEDGDVGVADTGNAPADEFDTGGCCATTPHRGATRNALWLALAALGFARFVRR